MKENEKRMWDEKEYKRVKGERMYERESIEENWWECKKREKEKKL